jgi:hypothetical protein
MRRLLSLWISCVLSLPMWVSAQTVATTSPQRESELSRSGFVQEMKPPLKLFPIKGKVLREPVDLGGTPPSFRLHFQVLTTTSASWTIDVVDVNDETKKLWSYKPSDPLENDFWSSQVFNQTATIVVTSTEENTPLQIIVDKVIVFFPDSTDLSLVSKKLSPIQNADPEIKEWGKAVAKLIVVRDETLIPFNCTGFLVAPDLLITNRHCSESGSEAKSIYAQFDYDALGLDKDKLPQIKVKELVISSCDLDFALLRLERPAPFLPGDTRRALRLGPSIQLGENQTLIVIQHAGGQPKQISITGCTVKVAKIIGNSSTITDFGHTCDTTPSSSGAPVQFFGAGLAINQGLVIGLHHLGFRTDTVQAKEPDKINRAVSIDLIIDYIRRNKPLVLKEMGLN